LIKNLNIILELIKKTEQGKEKS